MTRPTPSAAQELLPCPFCGKAYDADRDFSIGVGATQPCLMEPGEPMRYGVICSGCGASSSLYCDTETEAIAAWNRRAALAQPVREGEHGGSSQSALTDSASATAPDAASALQPAQGAEGVDDAIRAAVNGSYDDYMDGGKFDPACFRKMLADAGYEVRAALQPAQGAEAVERAALNWAIAAATAASEQPDIVIPPRMLPEAKAFTAALAALRAAPVGWVCVPREPTREMLRAAYKQANEVLLSHEGNMHCKTDEERSAHAILPVYRAMISARPASPRAPADVERLIAAAEAEYEKAGISMMSEAKDAMRRCTPYVEWRTMDSAPKDGTEFIYQNQDGAVSTCAWQSDDCGHNWYDIHGDQIAYPVRWLSAAPRATADVERATVERLREALRALVEIDDGDQPALWGWDHLFEEARAALAADEKERRG